MTGVAPLGAVSHRFNFLNSNIMTKVKIDYFSPDLKESQLSYLMGYKTGGSMLHSLELFNNR